jgi:hypothetical protein
MILLRNLNQIYLPSPLHQSVALYHNYPNTMLRKLEAVRVAFLISFVATTVTMMLLFYTPLVDRLNDDRRRTCLLLLMIPPMVLAKMKNVQNIVLKIASSTSLDS